MKTTFTFIFLMLSIQSLVYSQPIQTEVTKQDGKVKKISYSEDTKQDHKISLIVGVGASYITNNLYEIPSIDPRSNNVIIEKAQDIKTSMNFGIAYTPRTIGLQRGKQGIRVPYGWTFITFINPVSFTQTTKDAGFFKMVDFGVGIGWKFTGDLLIAGTVEFFNVRQPKDWFINEFKDNDAQYVLESGAQQSFDTTDNNIFENKLATTVGFKICYSFDLVKSLKSDEDSLKLAAN